MEKRVVTLGEIRPWDPAEYLNSPEEVAAYLEAILEEHDPDLLNDALEDIGRSKGMTLVTEQTGISLEDLRTAFSLSRNPQLPALLRVLGGLKLQVMYNPHHSPLASTGTDA